MRNLLLTLVAVLVSGTAAAHTKLESTVPADGATLGTVPEELVLTFSEPVTLTAVIVRAADGTEHELDGLPTERAERFAVTPPELGPGRFRVDWRALSADTHVIDGQFAFIVEAGALN